MPTLSAEEPANERAYERMCTLHDALQAAGCAGAELQRLLIRVLFCLFAEDTGIFAPDAFAGVVRHTREDGSDLGAQLSLFFEVLNTPAEHRTRPPRRGLVELPYVDGLLFRERVGFAGFDARARAALLACADFCWAKVSPVVFGSLFQGVLEDAERRKRGTHYTSERDIMRVLDSLFLDDLHAELRTILDDRSTRRNASLDAFHRRLREIHILDPACGCGSFLILSYRELRELEMEVVRERVRTGQQVLDVRTYLRVDVDQFFGIELDEWPARIAEVAMWLMDHQMNVRAAELFGQSFARLPLVSSARIVRDNALQIDWDEVLAPAQATYVVGNPPFIGKAYQTAEQKADMRRVWGGQKGAGTLNYLTAWYKKAADYIRGQRTRVAFVSANSIANGEQASLLWQNLFAQKVKIQFAHRTFPWISEARGRAHVHVVIVGFGLDDAPVKRVFDYEASGEHAARQAVVSTVHNISPYLVEGADFAVSSRGEPICAVLPMSFGNMPNDGGHLLLTESERAELLASHPEAAKLIRPFVGPNEFVNGKKRWCLWLVDAAPEEWRRIRPIAQRLEAVAAHRRASSRRETKSLATQPAIFGEIRQPKRRYLGVPKTGAERRTYVPMGFFPPEAIASTDLLTVEAATYYELGVLSSLMHMAWVNNIGGRFKSDPRYSASLVYNTFAWPREVDVARRAAVETAARAIEAARAAFLPPHGTSTLADLYDPATTPPPLASAHMKLDRAVERCYREAPFDGGERQRLELLMALHIAATETARARR